MKQKIEWRDADTDTHQLTKSEWVSREWVKECWTRKHKDIFQMGNMKKSFFDEFHKIREAREIAIERWRKKERVFIVFDVVFLRGFYFGWNYDQSCENNKLETERRNQIFVYVCVYTLDAVRPMRSVFFLFSHFFLLYFRGSFFLSCLFQFGGFARDRPKFIKLESLFLFTVFFVCFYLSIASFFIRFTFYHPLSFSVTLTRKHSFTLYQWRVNKNVSLFYVYVCVHVYFHWCADNDFSFQEVSSLSLTLCLFVCFYILNRSLHHFHEMNFYWRMMVFNAWWNSTVAC